MSRAPAASSDVAFSASVKAVQTAKGSREAYARLERRGGFQTAIDDELAAFLGAQRSFVMASASADGQPYVQHRGGPPGFLRVLDAQTLAFADLRGNRQYITAGNLAENPRVCLLFVDYATRARVKIWGEAELAAVSDPRARALGDALTGAEHVILVRVRAWDANCPKHIPRRFEAEDVERALAERDARIAELERRLAAIAPGAARAYTEKREIEGGRDD